MEQYDEVVSLEASLTDIEINDDIDVKGPPYNYMEAPSDAYGKSLARNRKGRTAASSRPIETSEDMDGYKN